MAIRFFQSFLSLAANLHQDEMRVITSEVVEKDIDFLAF